MIYIALALTAAFFIASTSVHAELLERLNGLAYYDTESDLTWLADANYAMTSGHNENGRMNWAEANAWVASLDIDGVAGADGWRLPNTLQLDPSCDHHPPTSSEGISYNCSGSEMGNMFYNVLGGIAGESILTNHNSNFYLFKNVQPEIYWSATEYTEDPFYAWYFAMGDGTQGYGGSKHTNTLNAWPVMDGDIGAAPEPASP